MNDLKRRQFLRQSVYASAGLFLAPNFISCDNDDNVVSDIPANLNQKNFDYGVASFDPSSDSVTIWTRYDKDSSAQIIWQVSTEKEFKSPLRSGKEFALSSRDYTIAIELQNLTADSKLYYRFINQKNGDVSAIGETITLPSNPNSVKMAICSCSNYQAGLFNAYNAIAKSDAQVVVHLGDYFYEYPAGGYGSTPENAFLNRKHSPATEILSLEDYRTRYKQYRADKDLQLAHQMKPFICVWDDHEIANDTWKNGAENHDPKTEGSFEDRKRNAIQAYSEYIPVKTNDINKIYRSIQFGDLLNLIMLDTRVIGRDKQLEYGNYYDEKGNFLAPKFQKDWLSPTRTLLGAEQKAWLTGQLASSNAKWQVLGQQVLMGKMLLPAEMLGTFGKIVAEVSANGSASAETLQFFEKQLKELVVLKSRLLQNDPTLTEQEKARITTVLPYNLDAWDGYPVEREMIYAAAGNKNLVCLAGDTHNAWQSNLMDNGKKKKGFEIACSSISSPGLEAYLGADKATTTQFAGALSLLIDDLKYANVSERGYTMITFSQADVKAEWVYVNTILSENYSTQIGNVLTLS